LRAVRVAVGQRWRSGGQVEVRERHWRLVVSSLILYLIDTFLTPKHLNT
jgi:hypothetical protein